MHGTPGSRTGPNPRGILLHRLGVRLIGYDRPGYGESTRQQGRSVVDAAADVEDIANDLGLDEFAVVGRSGGGPHALACAARLPHLVKKVALLVTLGPSDADDLDWYQGMGGWNNREYRMIDRDDSGSLSAIVRRAEKIRADPEELLRSLENDLSEQDRRIVDDIEMRELLMGTYEEALKNGAQGWLDDVVAFRRPWGFDPDEIKAPALFWHGADDGFSPVEHTRWLADRVPQSERWIENNASHFSAFEVFPTILAWIVGNTTSTFAERRTFARI